MFYYFGRKGRAAKSYPAPMYPLVIEPFAGSMGYSLFWKPERAIGIEKHVEIVNLWHRLVNMSEDELRQFPTPVVGERSSDRWVLLADQSNGSSTNTQRKVTWFMQERFENQRGFALRNHAYARANVLYAQGDYRQAPDVECCWFIDPPYQGVKHGYKHGQGEIDFDELAQWCMTRRGQVIVCEGPLATWLPFQAHSTWQGLPMFGGDQANVTVIEKRLEWRTHARCIECSTTFPATRADARFCSARCRQRASRKSRNT